MEETFKDFGKRLKQALDEKGMKAHELAEKLGVGANTISNYIHEKSYPSLSVLLKIVKTLNTTADFLIGARPVPPAGNPTAKDQNEEYPLGNKLVPFEKGAQYIRVGYTPGQDASLQVLVVSTNKDREQNIVFVPQEAEAAYAAGYKDSEFISTLPTFSLPGLTNGAYRAFSVRGNVMETAIKPGDWVVGRYVTGFQEVQLGSICVVVLKDKGFVCKRVEKHFDQPGIVLHADNKDYQPYQPQLEDIAEIWEVSAIVRRFD